MASGCNPTFRARGFFTSKWPSGLESSGSLKPSALPLSAFIPVLKDPFYPHVHLLKKLLSIPCSSSSVPWQSLARQGKMTTHVRTGDSTGIERGQRLLATDGAGRPGDCAADRRGSHVPLLCAGHGAGGTARRTTEAGKPA